MLFGGIIGGTNLNLLLYSNKSLLLKYVDLVVMDNLTELTIKQAKPGIKQYKLFDGGGMFDTWSWYRQRRFTNGI